MASSLNEYRTKLLNTIFHATSRDEIQTHIETALSHLKQHTLNGHLILRFINKLVSELELFVLINSKETGRENNAETAINILISIKKEMEPAEE